MTPKKFLQWVISISAAFWIVLMFFHVSQEVYFQDFPILRMLLATRHPIILSFVMVCAAAAIATLVVFLFGATAGKIQIKIFGLNLSGPSGPVILWCVAFLVLMAGLVALR